MVNKFCPKCGKATESGELCSECATTSFSYTPPLVQISEFQREFHKGHWRRFNDLEKVIITRVQEALGEEIPVTLEPFEFVPRPKEKTTLFAHIERDGEDVRLPVKLSYMQCDFGQKQKTGYYEGILQLRHPHEQVISYIDKEMIHLAPKGVFISKTVEQKEGVDLYFTNKMQMQLLGQKIVAKFGGDISSHPQLFSRNHQTSKDIYRLNVLIVLPRFYIGDLITFEYPRKGKLYVHITKMGKLVQGKDMVLGKHVGFELKNCKDIQVQEKKKTTVCTSHPKVTVLHPETFQEEELAHPPEKTYNPGDEVSVVLTDKGIFLLE